MKFLKGLRFSLIVAVLLSLVVLGCATAPPKMLDRALKGPQVVVNPQEIPLGVASLMEMTMIIEGAGFRPADTILISLVGQKDIDVALSLAKVAADGTFKAEFGQSQQASLSKVMGILKAGTRTNEKGDTVMVITRDPIPKGSYKIRATSLIAPLTAETPVEVASPPIVGRIKDVLGKMLGKIEDKR